MKCDKMPDNAPPPINILPVKPAKHMLPNSELNNIPALSLIKIPARELQIDAMIRRKICNALDKGAATIGFQSCATDLGFVSGMGQNGKNRSSAETENEIATADSAPKSKQNPTPTLTTALWLLTLFPPIVCKQRSGYSLVARFEQLLQIDIVKYEAPDTEIACLQTLETHTQHLAELCAYERLYGRLRVPVEETWNFNKLALAFHKLNEEHAARICGMSINQFQKARALQNRSKTSKVPPAAL